MQIIKSTPENPTIMQRDGQILKAASVGIILTICFSVYTEFNFISSLLSNYITPLPFYIDSLINFISSLFVVSIIEGTGLIALAYFIDNIIKGYWKGNKLNMIASLLLAIVCYSFSVSVSLLGREKVSEKWNEPPTIETTSKIDSTKNNERNLILKTYSSDSLLTESNYNNQISSVKNVYAAKVEREQEHINKYDRKEVREGKSYTSKKTYYRAKIAEHKASRDQEIQKLEVLKLNDLTTTLNERKENIKDIKKVHQKQSEKVIASNDKNINSYDDSLKSTSSILKYGIFFSLPLLFFCLIIQRNTLHQAGVEEQCQHDDFYFRDSIFSRFKNLIRVKFLSIAHSFFDNQFSKIQDLKPEAKKNKIFKRQDLTEYVDLNKIDVSQMNFKANEAAIPIAERQVPKKHKNDKKKKKRTAQERQKEPIEEEHLRHPYDSTGGTAQGDTKVIEKVVFVDAELIECKHPNCTNKFKPFPKNKKFCSPKCKKENWTLENGREPMMKKRK